MQQLKKKTMKYLQINKLIKILQFYKQIIFLLNILQQSKINKNINQIIYLKWTTKQTVNTQLLKFTQYMKICQQIYQLPNPMMWSVLCKNGQKKKVLNFKLLPKHNLIKHQINQNKNTRKRKVKLMMNVLQNQKMMIMLMIYLLKLKNKNKKILKEDLLYQLKLSVYITKKVILKLKQSLKNKNKKIEFQKELCNHLCFQPQMIKKEIQLSMLWTKKFSTLENILLNKEMTEIVYMFSMKVKLPVKRYLKKVKKLYFQKIMFPEKVSENQLFYIIVPELLLLKLLLDVSCIVQIKIHSIILLKMLLPKKEKDMKNFQLQQTYQKIWIHMNVLKSLMLQNLLKLKKENLLQLKVNKEIYSLWLKKEQLKLEKILMVNNKLQNNIKVEIISENQLYQKINLDKQVQLQQAIVLQQLQIDILLKDYQAPWTIYQKLMLANIDNTVIVIIYFFLRNNEHQKNIYLFTFSYNYNIIVYQCYVQKLSLIILKQNKYQLQIVKISRKKKNNNKIKYFIFLYLIIQKYNLCYLKVINLENKIQNIYKIKSLNYLKPSIQDNF